MKKRMIMIALAAVLCLSFLAGCNQQQSDPGVTQPESTGIELPDVPLG